MQDLVEWTGKAFPELNKEDAVKLAGCFELCELNAGDVLFKAGDSADSLFVLIEGRLAVSMDTGFNGKSQVIALLRPLAPVGEGSLAGRDARTVTVKAVEEVSLLRLKKDSFHIFAADNPAGAARLLQMLLHKSSRRLEKCSERLVHVL